MNRPHRADLDRLACLTADEHAAYAVQDAPTLLAHAEQLLAHAARLDREAAGLRAKVKAIEVYAGRALRSVGRVSAVVERPDGEWMSWTRHLDGTGFLRTRTTRPVRGDGAPP